MELEKNLPSYLSSELFDKLKVSVIISDFSGNLDAQGPHIQ